MKKPKRKKSQATRLNGDQDGSGLSPSPRSVRPQDLGEDPGELSPFRPGGPVQRSPHARDRIEDSDAPKFGRGSDRQVDPNDSIKLDNRVLSQIEHQIDRISPSKKPRAKSKPPAATLPTSMDMSQVQKSRRSSPPGESSRYSAGPSLSSGSNYNRKKSAAKRKREQLKKQKDLMNSMAAGRKNYEIVGNAKEYI